MGGETDGDGAAGRAVLTTGGRCRRRGRSLEMKKMTTMVVAWFLLNRGEGEEERGGVGWVEGGPRRRRRRRG